MTDLDKIQNLCSARDKHQRELTHINEQIDKEVARMVKQRRLRLEKRKLEREIVRLEKEKLEREIARLKKKSTDYKIAHT